MATKTIFDSRNYQFTGKAFTGMTEGTDTEGGHTVPSPLANFFKDELPKNSWARKLFEVRSMGGKTLDIPLLTSGDAVYLSDEGKDLLTEGGADQASTSVSKPVWSQLTLTAKKFAGLTGYSTELEEDSVLNIAEIALMKIVRALNEYEEQAFIQGESGGSKFGWSAGDTRRAFDGLIDIIQGAAAGTGGNWTPDASTFTNWQDGASTKLTTEHMLQLLATIEENRGECNTIFVSPTIAARLRDPIEFEMLQTVKDIGPTEAALIKGFVGKFYTANIYVSHFMPTGVAVFNTSVVAPKDSLIIGMDKDAVVIGDRRRAEILTRHRFYQDINEIRLTERIAFGAYYPQLVAGVADVQAAI